MKVYHYSNSAGMSGIKNSGCIRQSTDIEYDAILGAGVYLTTMSPNSYSKEQIAKNNYSK